jgi:serine phosphatase RsbU (regulator of sigma subunit)
LQRLFRISFLIILIVFNYWGGVLAQNSQGVFDLRKWDFAKQGTVQLDTKWQFYYQGFLLGWQFDTLSHKTYLRVPSASWDEIKWQGKTIHGKGYATYRLKVLLPEKHDKLLGIRCLDQSTAYQIFINKDLVYQLGKIGTFKKSMIPSPEVGIFYFEPKSDSLDIVIQISNFYHRKGGLWNSIQLGTYNQIRQTREYSIAITVFLSGSLILMAIYHLVLFLYRRQEPSVLYFSILCLIVPIRLLFTNENYILDLFPNMPWLLKYRIEYISFFLIPAFIFSFLRAIFPNEISKLATIFIHIVCWGVVLFTMFTEAGIFTYSIFIFHPMGFIAIVVIFYGLTLAIIRRREGAKTFAIGSFFLATSTVNDILHASAIVNTAYLIPVGFFVFFFSQAVLLGSRFSKAFVQVANLSEKLGLANSSLEQNVQDRTRQLQEANEELSSRQEKLNETVQSLNSALDIVQTQKKELEEVHKDLTASVDAAKKIQEATLPRIREIDKALPESFILFRPKDVVSGDFYWFSQIEYTTIIIAADCTGHGIPGAFMSLIGNDLLDEIIDIRNIITPSEILNELRVGIKKVLRQEETNGQDGMDIAVCAITRKPYETPILEYAGSYNPLIYVKNNELHHIKADKLIVGGFKNYVDQPEGFHNHTIEVDSPITFYIFSDGFQDQFGGERKKKFMASKFHDLLFSIHDLPANGQKIALQNSLETWMNASHQTQIDDILVIGVKI